MFAAQPVVDAARPALEVGEDLVDPGKDEMSGGLAEDMDVMAIRRNAAVAGPAVGLGDGVGTESLEAALYPSGVDRLLTKPDNRLRSGLTMIG